MYHNGKILFVLQHSYLCSENPRSRLVESQNLKRDGKIKDNSVCKYTCGYKWIYLYVDILLIVPLQSASYFLKILISVYPIPGKVGFHSDVFLPFSLEGIRRS